MHPQSHGERRHLKPICGKADGKCEYRVADGSALV